VITWPNIDLTNIDAESFQLKGYMTRLWPNKPCRGCLADQGHIEGYLTRLQSNNLGISDLKEYHHKDGCSVLKIF
jgi:hypothetical protein